MPESVLAVEGLSCGYGEAVVLTDVSFELAAGLIHIGFVDLIALVADAFAPAPCTR